MGISGKYCRHCEKQTRHTDGGWVILHSFLIIGIFTVCWFAPGIIDFAVGGLLGDSDEFRFIHRYIVLIPFAYTLLLLPLLWACGLCRHWWYCSQCGTKRK